MGASSQQLLDSLTSHIALYHSHSHPHPNPNPNPNPNPRSAILRHLSSLPLPSRQSFLTFTSPSFVQILLKMRAQIAANNGSSLLFFLLPDLPSTCAPTSPSLPSLLSRRATSLLSRQLSLFSGISDGILLFGSENEEVIDSVTVSEDLVADVDRFVELMDLVSSGSFLMGEEGGLGEEWKEVGWLKDRGYFSLEEFVANRLEVVLRRRWGKRGGGGGKGKGKGRVNVWEGGESVFWRKKGCLDWWEGIDSERRRAFCLGFLGKAAKSLVNSFFLRVCLML